MYVFIRLTATKLPTVYKGKSSRQKNFHTYLSINYSLSKSNFKNLLDYYIPEP